MSWFKISEIMLMSSTLSFNIYFKRVNDNKISYLPLEFFTMIFVSPGSLFKEHLIFTNKSEPPHTHVLKERDVLPCDGHRIF